MMTEKVTVFCYSNGHAVYVGNRLASRPDGDGVDGELTPFLLCRYVGVPAEFHHISRDDMPKVPKGFFTVAVPPPDMAALESHLARVAEAKRAARIAALEAELARLKGAGPHQ